MTREYPVDGNKLALMLDTQFGAPLYQGREAASLDVSDVVQEVVGALKPQWQEVLYLRYYDQLTLQEIADIRGVSRQAVGAMVKRAHRAMTEALAAA